MTGTGPERPGGPPLRFHWRLLQGGETARGTEVFSRRSVAHGGREWTAEELRPGAGLRLYRATADSHWILAKDGRPGHRIPVRLT